MKTILMLVGLGMVFGSSMGCISHTQPRNLTPDPSKPCENLFTESEMRQHKLALAAAAFSQNPVTQALVQDSFQNERQYRLSQCRFNLLYNQ